MSNVVVIIIIFIAFKMKIMIIVDIQGNICLELSNLEREMGEAESSRKHIR